MQSTVINNKIIEKPVLKVWVSANEISMDKLKIHDVEAFKSFYKFYAPAVYGSVLRNLKDEAKCDIILEQTFIQAWSTISSFDGSKCKMFTWLNRIARNISNQY
ncbi:RNA polymerase sigma factor [Pedobacter rhodius]|uniref:Sigma factor n=1 Tax=Pedobacter rhodius TaxID=3004098 RepID=A0ABT4KSH4_9SPHI|nr:sigma factor [Pedobacter sp. SJ11]MCZ4221870.1 sigma factor [Pedobacter sp. SJ11]